MKPCTECQNCSSIWSPGTEEYNWQKCAACGWKPGDPIEEDHGWGEDDYYDCEHNGDWTYNKITD